MRIKFKRLAKNLPLVIFGIVFSLVLAEVIVRILPKDVTKIDFEIKSDNRIFSYSRAYEYKPDSERNWTSRGPLTFWHFNNFGFRERGVQERKVPGNVYRILVIGDSITMGLGVEDYEAFPRQLEKRLNANGTGPKATIFEVLNFGLWAQGPKQYEQILKDVSTKLNPDLVIVGYFYGNDPYDDWYYVHSGKYRFLKAIPDMLFPYKVNEFLKNHSYLYQLILTRYYHMVESADINVPHNDNNLKEGIESNKDSIKNMKKISDQIGAKFLVLGLPSDREVIKNEKEDYMIRQSALENLGVNYLELYPNFMKYPRKQNLFIEGDTHYTIEGNSFVAKSIDDYFVKNNFVPEH